MRDVLYLVGRYLVYHRMKTVILVTAITLILYLPTGLNVLVNESAAELTARAESTPLLIGARGSPLELVLSSLYFDSDPPATLAYAEAGRVAESGLALPVPLYVRFRARQHPIVGTSLEYLTFRGLRFAAGRAMAVLGECVVGARVAQSLGVGVGDAIVSSPESAFDLAGIYPLKMPVVGVLTPTYTPDDGAIFVDLKTAWIIQGLGHGHQDLEAAEAASAVLRRDGNTITANASLVQYNEITPANIASFHFHGDLGSYPITAVLAVPDSPKSATILMGRYAAPDEEQQIVRPAQVMEELLDTIYTVQGFLVAAVMVVGAATVATAALVFLLSLRLRRREIETVTRIGGSRARVAALLVSEIAGVLVISLALATALTLLTSRFGSLAVRTFLLS